ncbi:MAG TPA: hypothetical protein VLX92_20350, partial [Kofleriaceae bacterium]|nr:hypothetical protein [Kofleriaceae bacterium]
MGKLALAVIALSSAAAHADPCDRVDGFEHCTIDGDEETREVAPRIRWEGEAAWRIGVTSFDGDAAF